jgi:transcriptional regulator
MYVPRMFAETDRAALVGHVRARSFGILITHDREIAHLPFVIDDVGTMLRAHVALGNPLVARLRDGAPMTAVFLGPDAYISASWYGSPNEEVPTWNYVAVHAHGSTRVLDREATRVLLADLTAAHEAEGRWSLDALEGAFVDELLEGIVGFALDVERLEGKAKLSQNRSIEDRERVIAALGARGRDDDRAMAVMMGRTR